MAANLKSDVNAKKAFVEELLRRGYEDVKITGSPADITARIGPNLFYFEVKYTAQESHYFGAATLTEWQEALANEKTDIGSWWLCNDQVHGNFMNTARLNSWSLVTFLPLKSSSRLESLMEKL